MIYTTQTGEVFDLEQDFSSAERHILQKLLLWKDLAGSVEEFRTKKQEALRRGWGDSGPVPESRNLQRLTKDLEEQVAKRGKRPEIAH
ncbi:MAG: hypothetical protein M1438_20555 [Deltaproteobacteria bacterium]|nr:hypothetical protein [Deltaproteobacteria bacterium]